MTDLNKERKAFEAIKEIQDSIRREQLIFNTKLGCYTKKSGKMCVSANWTNGAWFVFERKAKAQAVPETHIVVPKQPTPKMIDATWDFDDEIIEMSSNTRNEFIWKKMVEASESGAEQ
ncbi:hypothetical protein NRA55_13425 [Acinetobacter baumannii]|nr:hypothetical protein [Acinetobacter baumannii]